MTKDPMEKIQMVDLRNQYLRIKGEIDAAIQGVLDSTAFIGGKPVGDFGVALEKYLNVPFVIPCGNGTDALQIAMMALGFKAGDEVILPAFTYPATVEVIYLLGLKPVFADVYENTFNIDITGIEKKITSRTVAIVPVHLFGQCADMEPLLALAAKHDLYVIEDAAQALGTEYTFADGNKRKAGTMATIGMTSFFPTKNLGCFGDGGALFTSDARLAERIRMIANHGQKIKYHHDIIGVNSRLDTIQAAVLNVKLQYLDDYTRRRREVAEFYDNALCTFPEIGIPVRHASSTHGFHQYTLTLNSGRDDLKAYLAKHGIPTMIYYPLPLHLQNAYSQPGVGKGSFPVAEKLSKSVISLPIHTEMTSDQLAYIVATIKEFPGYG